LKAYELGLGVALGVLLMGYDSSRNGEMGSPEQCIDWSGAGGGWQVWGAGSSCLYAVSVNPTVLDVWRWVGQSMEKQCSVPVEDGTLSVTFPSSDRWLVYAVDEADSHSYLYLGDIQSGQVRERWMAPDDWCSRLADMSRNGKYMAVWATRDSPEPEASNTVQIGFVAPDGKSLQWVLTTVVPSAFSMINRVVPSEDGKLIGLTGWSDGVAMIDVATQKVRWLASYKRLRIMGGAEREKDTEKDSPFVGCATCGLAFTPDSKYAYVGEGTGCLSQFDVATGDVVNQWFATSSGKEEPGQHPIMNVSISPDGRFVAAGTGPEGDVYLYATKDGKRWLLNHGGSTILMTSFSPDSKRLASYAAGEIKIWKLPE
jgi:hypothetical protein